MDNAIITITTYVVAWVIVGIVFGIGASCAGGGFLWGFFFGPFGMIVAAIRAQGALTREQIRASSSASAAGLKASQSKAASAKQPPPSRTVNCPKCGVTITDIPGSGTYLCGSCGSYLTIK